MHPTYGKNPSTDKPFSMQNQRAYGIKHIQKVIGTLIYYARAIDSTILMEINAISAAQFGTTTTAATVAWLLDYAATYPDATVRYNASQMIFRIYSNESYQSETKSRSCAGINLFLGSPKYNDTNINNCAIHTTSEIIKNVMSEASKAKCAATFINCKTAAPLCITLKEMGHP